jgi:4-amino-4-deoxy-L-arabinose transferase-like glycosyltransferase
VQNADPVTTSPWMRILGEDEGMLLLYQGEPVTGFDLNGDTDTTDEYVLALLDTLHCGVWILIAWRLLGRRIALLTGIVMAFCPYFLYLVVTAGSDGPFLLLHAVFVAILIGAWRTRRVTSFAAAGVAVGIATLCRAVSLFEPFFVAPIMVLGAARHRGRVVVGAAVMLLCFLLVLTPWTVRNWFHFGRLVPIQSIGGRTLLISNFDRGDPSHKQEIAKAFQDRDTWENRDEKLMRRGLSLILEDPGGFALRCAKRLVEMWGSTYTRRFDLQLGLANGVLLIVAGFGLFRLRHRWRDLLPVLAAASYFIAFHSLMYVLFRYLLPVVPVLVMLAAAAVQPRSVIAALTSSDAGSSSGRESPPEGSREPPRSVPAP